MAPSEQTIFDKKVNGITWKVIGTVGLFALTVAIGGHKAYTDILLAIKDSNNYNVVQDVQLKALQVQVDKLEIEVRELKYQRQQTN